MRNWIATLCNKIIICILLLTIKVKVDHISTSDLFHHTWQTGELSWGATTSKVTWPCDHLATWSHVLSEKRHISTFARTMTAKLDQVEVYSKVPPSIESFDALSTWSSDEKHISTTARPMATKLDRVVGSNAGLLSTKSHNLLITWSHKII